MYPAVHFTMAIWCPGNRLAVLPPGPTLNTPFGCSFLGSAFPKSLFNLEIPTLSKGAWPQKWILADAARKGASRNRRAGHGLFTV